MDEEYFFSSPFVKKDRSVFEVQEEQPKPFVRKSKKERKKEEDEEAEKELQQLVIVGYECKIFRDDHTAWEIDDGQHLIPWFGNEKLMIDRYDVRALLDDRRLFKKNKNSNYLPSQEDLDVEEACNYERYYDLERAEEAFEKEEEQKRQQMLEDKSAYHFVNFKYDDDTTEEDKYGGGDKDAVGDSKSTTTIKSTSATDVKGEEPFVAPQGVPKGIALPPTEKVHKIIEQTAKFIAAKGPSVINALKKKQENNPHFSFFSEDDKLHQYYLYLLATAKGETYIPPRKEVSSPIITSPSAASPKLAHIKEELTEIPGPASPTVKAEPVKVESVSSPTIKQPASPTSSYGVVNIPPDDVRAVIDKLASFVEKNGRGFEAIVKEKEKNNEKFSFLLPWNHYNGYYRYTVDQLLAAKEKGGNPAKGYSGEAKIGPITFKDEPNADDSKVEMITEFEITPTIISPTLQAEKKSVPSPINIAPVPSPPIVPLPPIVVLPKTVEKAAAEKAAAEIKKRMKLERLKKAKELVEQMKTPEEKAKEEAEKQKQKDLEFVEKLRQQAAEKELQKQKDKEYEEYLKTKDRHREYSSKYRKRSRSRSRSRSRDRKSGRKSRSRSPKRSSRHSRSRSPKRDHKDRDHESRKHRRSPKRASKHSKSRSRSPKREKRSKHSRSRSRSPKRSSRHSRSPHRSRR